MDKIEGEKSKI